MAKRFKRKAYGNMREHEEEVARNRGLGKDEDAGKRPHSLDDEFEEEYAPYTLSEDMKDDAVDTFGEIAEEEEGEEEENWDDESEVEPAEIKAGDHVRWNNAEEFLMGKVVDVLDAGEVEVNMHNVPVKMNAATHPVAIVKAYERSLEDSSWVDNNTFKAMPLHKMSKAEAPEDVIRPSNHEEGEEDVPKSGRRRKVGRGEESFGDRDRSVDDDWEEGHEGPQARYGRGIRKRAEEIEFEDEYEEEDRKTRNRMKRIKDTLNQMNGDDLELMADHIANLLTDEEYDDAEEFDWEDDGKEAEPPVDADSWDQIENQPRRINRDDESLEARPKRRKRDRHDVEDAEFDEDYEEDDFDVIDDMDNPSLVREPIRHSTKPPARRKRIRGRMR